MKILVIGHLGNMGRRYCAILKWLGIEYEGWDINSLDVDQTPYHLLEWDRAIIATPTDTHYKTLMDIDTFGKPWICEKPIVKDSVAMKYIANNTRHGYMVNNWRFVQPLAPNGIYYNYYNTGKDGTAWDCIQLIFLAQKNIIIETTSPVFNCRFIYNDRYNIQITTENIALSYVEMIKEFVSGNTKYLWDMGTALRATLKTEEYIKCGH